MSKKKSDKMNLINKHIHDVSYENPNVNIRHTLAMTQIHKGGLH